VKRLVEFLNERTPDLVLEEGPSNPGEALVFACALIRIIPSGQEGGDRYALLCETAEELWKQFETESPDPSEDKEIMEAGADLLAQMMTGTLFIENEDGTVEEVPYDPEAARQMRLDKDRETGDPRKEMEGLSSLAFTGPVGEA
jgi:hypothetical protein